MTNYEKLRMAETRQEMKDILFDFAEYVLRPNSEVNINEWLNAQPRSDKEIFKTMLVSYLEGWTNE